MSRVKGFKHSDKSKDKMRLAKMGEKNPRWNGGNSEYPNHAEFKRKIIEVLKISKGKCTICGEPAKLVHHVDGDKSNHAMINLIALCPICHESLHCNSNGRSVRGRATKYGIIFGMTLREIAHLFDVNPSTVHYWIKNPEKKEWLKNELKYIGKGG